ncbi:hypothetical protein LXL04_004418 [Taraxacum kok-saghyz]
MYYALAPNIVHDKALPWGEFTNFRDRKYIEGKVNYVDMVDIDEFSIHDLDAIMRGVKYVADYKLIRVYTEHGECTLLTYYMNPKPVRKVTIEQLDDDEEIGTTPILEQVIGTPSKIDTLLVPNETNAIVHISPEYNRTRFWKKDKVLSSCSNKLIMVEFDIDLYQQILEADSVVHIGKIAPEQVQEEVYVAEEIQQEQVVNEVVDEEDQVVNEMVVEEDEAVNEEVVEEDQLYVAEEIEQEQVEEQYAHVTELNWMTSTYKITWTFQNFKMKGMQVQEVMMLIYRVGLMWNCKVWMKWNLRVGIVIKIVRQLTYKNQYVDLQKKLTITTQTQQPPNT